MALFDLIINGYSSNSGGGRTGLISLLKALPLECKALVFIDQRFKPDFPLPAGVTIYSVPPSILGRLNAEWMLKEHSHSARYILRLGSVPPFFKSKCPTFVFFENRLLLTGEPLTGMPFRRRLRIYLERLLLHLFKKNAKTFIVQSESMAQALRLGIRTKSEILVLPFHATPAPASINANRNFDFIYVSSGDPHKNHRCLTDAWQLLATDGLRPSLALTLNAAENSELLNYIDQKRKESSLDIVNLGTLNPDEISAWYEKSSALIFPSTCESYGRPLQEATDLKIPVLAPELDYVRDVLDPAQTFSADSPLSIARAVRRFLRQPEKRVSAVKPTEFIDRLGKIASQ